jgi:Domain of unknown function (DUF4832)/Domain of unknown function (DUF4874)
VPPKVLLPKPGLTRVCFAHALIAALSAISVGHTASEKSTSSMPKSTVRVYEKSNQDILNPERGLFSPQEGVAGEGLKEIRRLHQVSVIRTYFALDAYRNVPLPADYLDKLDKYFQAVREGGLKAIVRFAYSSSMDQPDAPLDRILSHGDQLKPILQAHADIILMLEAGFIGAWGEWHSSKSGLDTDQGRKAVLLKLLAILPAERMVAVRCNFYKRAALGIEKPLSPSEAFSGSHHARVGAHNDCLGASQDDFGTYTANAIEAEKNFLNLDNRYVPQEGETCSPGTYARCANMVQDLKRMRWDLLNMGYHPAVLDGWKQEGCFNEVQKNLGYRFVLRQAEIQDSVKIGEGLRVSITLANEGWGKAFNPRGLELILRGVNGGMRYVLPLEYDPRRWGAGDSVRFEVMGGIPSGMLAGRYKLFLNLPDPMPRLRNRPEYSIRLANTGLWEDSTGLNDLMHTVTVHTNAGNGNHAGAFFLPVGTQGTVGLAGRIRQGHSRMPLSWRASQASGEWNVQGRAISVPKVR